MLSAWFGSKSSRHSHSRHTSSSAQPAQDNARSGPPDASSVSRSSQTPGNLTLPSDDVPPDADAVHAHINNPSVYAGTPSLIHSAEKDTDTHRTPEILTVSLEAPMPHDDQGVPTPEHPERALFTPQDAVLAQVFGKSVSATDGARGTTPPPAAQPSMSMATRTTDSLPPPPSMQIVQPAPTVRTGSRVTIYDPFSGAKLGGRSSAAGTTDVDPLIARLPTARDDHRLWSSLERILELQAEIAAMHADMEGVGKGAGVGAGADAGSSPGGVAVGTQRMGEGGPRKRSRRGQTLPIGDEETEEHSAGLAVSEISTEHSEGEDEVDDDDDARGFGKRRRDGEFARLVEQFAQRKTAIGGILNKLDDLSMALKTFHTLPPPLFDLTVPPSRSDTVSSSPTNASAPPSPLNLYPRRSSSPLSSISPLQIGNSVTPPMVPSLPVLLSTLASPVSESLSSDAVAHSLPQMIIPEAPRVESPIRLV